MPLKIAPVPEKKKAAPKPNACISCKREEAADNPGSKYTSNGENTMVVTFWMCDRCALPLGPGQGPIDLDDPTTRV
jgi:hypothetical protein